MNPPTFVYVSYIKTTPEELWNALTRSEFSEQYWGGRRLESDWKAGSSFKAYLPDGTLDLSGEVLEVDPPRRLAYTFDAGIGEKPSRVRFEIARLPARKPGAQPEVKLTVTHDAFPPGSRIVEGVSQGWPAFVSSLKSLLETGVALDVQGGCSEPEPVRTTG